jgi:plastocyanin
MSRAAAGATAAVLSGLALACFSEHTPTAPGTPRSFCAAGTTLGPDSALVTIQSFKFNSADIQVPRGTTVVWANCETAGPAHTTSADGDFWRSPLLAPADTFSHLFLAAGTFTYHCEPHPFMTGRVVVR